MKHLQNNSPEMKTVVETFIIEETQELIYDNEKLEEWNKKIEELGLIGQTKIVQKDKSPIPFMHLKKGLINVFETLCPRKVNVEEYNITPIPVEILDLIALSKREQYFDRIEIWYDDRNPDPVCVGIIGTDWYVDYADKNIPRKDGMRKQEAEKLAKETNGTTGNYSWTNTKYLLGKWADVKHSFEQLKEMAKKRFIEEKGNDYRKQIKEAQRGLDDLETQAFEQFA